MKAETLAPIFAGLVMAILPFVAIITGDERLTFVSLVMLSCLGVAVTFNFVVKLKQEQKENDPRIR